MQSAMLLLVFLLSSSRCGATSSTSGLKYVSKGSKAQQHQTIPSYKLVAQDPPTRILKHKQTPRRRVKEESNKQPTASPTESPTMRPSLRPTASSTEIPTVQPIAPSSVPSQIPTVRTTSSTLTPSFTSFPPFSSTQQQDITTDPPSGLETTTLRPTTLLVSFPIVSYPPLPPTSEAASWDYYPPIAQDSVSTKSPMLLTMTIPTAVPSTRPPPSTHTPSTAAPTSFAPSAHPTAWDSITYVLLQPFAVEIHIHSTIEETTQQQLLQEPLRQATERYLWDHLPYPTIQSPATSLWTMELVRLYSLQPERRRLQATTIRTMTFALGGVVGFRSGVPSAVALHEAQAQVLAAATSNDGTFVSRLQEEVSPSINAATVVVASGSDPTTTSPTAAPSSLPSKMLYPPLDDTSLQAKTIQSGGESKTGLVIAVASGAAAAVLLLLLVLVAWLCHCRHHDDESFCAHYSCSCQSPQAGRKRRRKNKRQPTKQTMVQRYRPHVISSAPANSTFSTDGWDDEIEIVPPSDVESAIRGANSLDDDEDIIDDSASLPFHPSRPLVVTRKLFCILPRVQTEDDEESSVGGYSTQASSRKGRRFTRNRKQQKDRRHQNTEEQQKRNMKPTARHSSLPKVSPSPARALPHVPTWIESPPDKQTMDGDISSVDFSYGNIREEDILPSNQSILSGAVEEQRREVVDVDTVDLGSCLNTVLFCESGIDPTAVGKVMWPTTTMPHPRKEIGSQPFDEVTTGGTVPARGTVHDDDASEGFDTIALQMEQELARIKKDIKERRGEN